jgi:hypothetical protein
LHVNPHVPPEHVAVAFAGAVHAVHDAPHVSGLVLSEHVPLQLWNPVLHAMPQLVPSHVAEPFDGTLHAVHDAPQWVASEVGKHALPHWW